MPGPDPDHFKSKAPDSNVQPELRTTELELSTSREAVIIIECLFKKKKIEKIPNLSDFLGTKVSRIKQNCEQHGFRHKWCILPVITCISEIPGLMAFYSYIAASCCCL